MSFAVEKLKATLRARLLPGFLFRWRAAANKVPDAYLYQPTFQPWRGLPQFRDLYREILGRTLASPENAWILYSLARQALAVPGDFFEAGVYRGGTAHLLSLILQPSLDERRLHLFDTFTGMPGTMKGKDLHEEHDFSDTNLSDVAEFVGKHENIIYHKGLIPDTFSGIEAARFAFAHVDVDIYQSVLDCCKFLYPRMNTGGILLFDDYGLPSCPGARAAVDEFFADKPEIPLVLHTGQAVAFCIHSSASPKPGVRLSAVPNR